MFVVSYRSCSGMFILLGLMRERMIVGVVAETKILFQIGRKWTMTALTHSLLKKPEN